MAEEAEISNSEMLINILMLGAFVNTPMRDGVCTPNDVGFTELQIAMALKNSGVMAGHDLVEVLGIAPMNVSRALRQLRDRGWIEDAPDNGNRRRRPVGLTQKGAKACESVEPDFNEVADALVGSLTKAQKQQFSKITHRVLANMAEWITSHHTEVNWVPKVPD